MAEERYVKMVNGVEVQMTPEEITQRKAEEAAWAARVIPVDVNAIMEQAFMNMLPQHLGMPYLTAAVIDLVMGAKLKVTESNKIDPTGMLGKAIISNLQLPVEMQADQQAILDLYPN